MRTEAAFIAAMAADPENDLPRLAFADWLQENGESERAELIRLQCDPAGDEARAEKLLKKHQASWDKPLRPLAGDIKYHRGFPHFLKADLGRLVEHQELLGLAPDWHLYPTRDGHDFFESQADLCARLASGPFVDRIRGLNLAWAGWESDELKALLAPPLLGRLRELRFGDEVHKQFGTLKLLQRSPELKLEVLGFGGDSYGGIGDRGCQTLAKDPRFASLTTLELPNNSLTAAGVKALAESPHLQQLRSLDLQGASNSTNTIGDDGARHLAGSANFRHLTDLNLVCNGISDDGFLALLRSPHLLALERLNLPANPLTAAALVALADSDGLPALSWLNVSGLMRHGITGEAVARLARSPRMERLTGLKLGGHPIGDEGAIALAESPNCRNLRELHIAECGIGTDAFTRMLESPHLAGVASFATYGNRVAKAKITALRARHKDRVGK